MIDYKPKVLYVTFNDGRCVEFSSAHVRAFATEFLDSPEHVPDEVRRAVEFQRCEVCPFAHEVGYCHALFPSLTVFNTFDRYPSYEPVEVAYLDPALDSLLTKKTSLQKAMQGVSILSLVEYCEFGRKYHDFFLHVNPLMKLAAIASRIYLNAFWLSGGDQALANQRLKAMTTGLQETITCQIKRMRLICKSDSFLNAFASTHVLTELLDHELGHILAASFEEHRRAVTDAPAEPGSP